MLDPTHPALPGLLQQIHDDWTARHWDMSDLAAFRMEADGDGGGDGGDGGDAGGGDGGSVDGDDGDLGDAGERALRAERQAKRDAEKAAKAEKKRADDLSARLEALENPTGDDAAKAQAALKKAADDAREEARSEANAAANRRVLAAEIKAAAGGVLSDPADAVKFIDLDDFDVDDDGNVDDAAIKAAIKKLVKDKPYLAGKPGGTGNGSADGGARNNGDGDKKAVGIGRQRLATVQRRNTPKQ